MPLNIFGPKKDEPQVIKSQTVLDIDTDSGSNMMLSDEQRENLEQDLAVLGAQDVKEEKVQQEAVKAVVEQAEASLIELQKIKLGRCPKCGAHLSSRISANICEECGWNKYDVPKFGRIIVHLKDGETVEGEHGYVLKNGYCLLTRGDVVYAKFPQDAYAWIEYKWTEEELEQRRRAHNAQLQVPCGWCGADADVNKDGFHLVHIAFGSSQERYCFCSDECYEAFRKMYPSRVHRNCYETNCNECNQCLKRYGDEAEGIRDLAKDRIRMSKYNN
ncbi:MAG: hypothetical protein J6X55_03045 [Victivallales bacterium]|nr:hypothetical protein [Victivallales bacterium]